MKSIRAFTLLGFFLGTNIAFCFATITKIYPAPNSIHNAINNAHTGDTLFLQNGIYKEHDLDIQKKIIVIGNGNPVIDAENKFQAFIIYSDSVTIQGLEIRNVGKSGMIDMAGIRIVNAKYVTIKKNKLINNNFGIYLQNATECYILDNTIHSDFKDEINGGNGIHAWKSDH